jgi:hypothetical protein
MKTTIVALSVAALIAATSGAFAQNIPSKTSGLQHKVSRKYHPGISGQAPLHRMQAKGSKNYPAAFGYLPSEPDRDLEMSRLAGGGGGGGM